METTTEIMTATPELNPAQQKELEYINHLMKISQRVNSYYNMQCRMTLRNISRAVSDEATQMDWVPRIKDHYFYASQYARDIALLNNVSPLLRHSPSCKPESQQSILSVQRYLSKAEREATRANVLETVKMINRKI